MKLQSAIKPRRDGVVNVVGADGKPYVFAPDDSGELVCNIEDEATLRTLTKTGNFFAVDDADERVLMDMAEANSEAPDADDLDDEPDLNALPIEEYTPPKRFKPGKAKAK